MSFVHLHVHSTYSILDGLCNIKALVTRAKELGMPAVALTDHGVMFGAIEFYNAAIKAGIKPIIGIETYIAARRMCDRDPNLDRKSYHVLLLAENETGYRNLLRIASISQLEGFYYYPRIDHAFLAEHSEGLICTSGCLTAEVPRAILQDNLKQAREKLDWYYQVFGKGRFFFELQEHGIPEIKKVNNTLLALCKEYGGKVIAANDVHYINPEDFHLQDILLCLQTGTVLTDPKRMKMTDNSYYLRSPEEMKSLFGNIPGAIENTLAIAERCNLDLGFKGYHLPLFEVPGGYDSQTYLRKLCEEGLQLRYGNAGNFDTARRRLEDELEIIHKMGFDTYFLIVWDLCRFARERDIWYNTRGSAAGSIVAYTLQITSIDPLYHGLIFERFLNPGRISMPDIDLDFQDDRRVEMLEYCSQRYGSDKVAQIITFGTMKARAAIRDVGRVMDIPLPEVDRIAKLLPGGPMASIADAVENVIEFKTLYEDTISDESKAYVKELIDNAKQMEGVVRNVGTHAAGVVITDVPLEEYLPLHRPTSSAEDTPIKTVTQFEMSILESLGLLKVDFLGLVTLTIMARACALIKQRHGIDYNLHNIPVDDPKSFDLLGRGETSGVFQVESSGMRRYLVEMKPHRLEHVVAMVALFRPGPMDFIPSYIRRMHGEEQVEYRHPAMAPIFEETYGIPVYQEQIMRAAVELAGYTASVSDELRKAISKKQKEQLLKHQENFVQGVAAKSIMPPETAKAIFEDWEQFARYGFNKAHAADYGVIAVQTAFLKANYPAEYMTAVISANKNDTSKVALYVADCRRLGIAVKPPEVNTSGWDFSIEDVQDDQGVHPVIRFGMGAIKNVGQSAAEAIINARNAGGSFGDLDDFARRVDLRSVGKRSLECLIKVGALDVFGERQAILNGLERILSVSANHFKASQAGQMSMFGGATGISESITLPAVKEPGSPRDVLGWERELMGLFVSDHPLNAHLEMIDQVVTHYSGQLSEANHEEKVRVAGIITTMRSHQTKTGKLMGFASIEDIQGSIELVIFPRAWDEYHALLKTDTIVIVEGKLDNQSGDPKVLVDRITTEFSYTTSTERPPAQTRNIAKPAETQKKPPVEKPLRTPAKPPDSPPPPPDAFPDDWQNNLTPEDDAGVSLSPQPVRRSVHKTANAALVNGIVVVQEPETRIGEERTPPYEAMRPLSADRLTLAADSEERRMITIHIHPNGDKKRDELRLRQILGTLISFPGNDRFSFNIHEGNRSTMIEFPNYTTHFCPELIAGLERFVQGEDIIVEPWA